MPASDHLPYALYRAEQVKFDNLAINEYGIPGQELMGGAGASFFGDAKGMAQCLALLLLPEVETMPAMGIVLLCSDSSRTR